MHIDILRAPDLVHAETDLSWGALSHTADGEWNGSGTVFLRSSVSGEWSVQACDFKEPLRTIRLRWNDSLPQPLCVLGDHWERGYGDLEWRGLAPERVLPWYFLAYDGLTASGYGVKTGPGAMIYWEADADGVTMIADVRSGNTGVKLKDRTLEVCTVLSLAGQEGESPFAFARRFCACMCDKPVLPDHPVYGGNNWYYAYGSSSHQKILEDSAFLSGLADSPDNRPYMVIDDGWQLNAGGINNGGPWTGNGRFPDMFRLAGEMEAAGVRPGIWFRPLLVHQPVPDSWVRYNEHGAVLDPSIPDVLDHVKEAVGTMSDWGYRLIKHDFTSYDMLGRWGFAMGRNIHGLQVSFADQSRTTAEIITGLYRAIAEASGPSLIMGCNTVGHLAAGLFHLQRTGDDTSGRVWERTRRMGVNTLAFRMPQHETFFSHDADCVGITPHIPWELNRQWLDLLAQSGTPLFVSADPALITAPQQTAIRKAFGQASRPQPSAEPLDWLANTCPALWRLNGRTASFQWNVDGPDTGSKEDNLWWRG